MRSVLFPGAGKLMIANPRLRSISVERALDLSESPTASKTIPSPAPTLDVPELTLPSSKFHSTSRIITIKSDNIDHIVCSDIGGCRTPFSSLRTATTTPSAPITELMGSADQVLSRLTHAVMFGLVGFVAVVGVR